MKLHELFEAKNHMGETEYQSVASWKRALKKKHGDEVKFHAHEGTIDAMIGDKQVGYWDDTVGTINEMKLDDLKIKVPTTKPRDPNQAVLAAKKNAGGAMRDKKHEFKRGEQKHKGRVYESIEDDQAELVDEFEKLIAKAKTGGMSSAKIAQYKAQFNELNSAFRGDEEDDDVLENAIEGMEELIDDLKDELE